MNESGVFIPYFRFSAASSQVRPQGDPGVQRERPPLDLPRSSLGIMFPSVTARGLYCHCILFVLTTLQPLFEREGLAVRLRPGAGKRQTVGKQGTWLVVRQPLAGLTGNGQHWGIRPAALASRSGNPSAPGSWPASGPARAHRDKTPGRGGTRGQVPAPVSRHSGAGAPADPGV